MVVFVVVFLIIKDDLFEDEDYNYSSEVKNKKNILNVNGT